MSDDWRDKLASINLDAADEPETLSPRADCPWRCYPNDPSCLCEPFTPHYDETIRANATPPEAWLTNLLDADELKAQQATILKRVLAETGRTIPTPELSHDERQARLRGIPAVGSTAGAIRGTRPGQ